MIVKKECIYCNFVAILYNIEMNSSQDLLAQTLKEHDLSVTTSRRIVFLALEDTEPLSMAQLVQKVSPDTHRTSVYRTVELFEKLGIIQRIQIGWKYKLELSNEFQDHHHHLTCMKCGKIESFQEPDIMHSLLEIIASEKHFNLQRHQLELQGVCATCQ